jgi:hypothetical protein
MGYLEGKIFNNGNAYILYKQPERKYFYTTRQLKEKVLEIMDKNEENGLGRICDINNKHQLQIRGKHLRRLLKSMPNVKQVGRKLVQKCQIN